MSKTPQKMVSFLVLDNFLWNHYSYSFSWFHCFGQKIAKTDSVHENARFVSPFLTQIVSGNFC